jgi:hypothetical protein
VRILDNSEYTESVDLTIPSQHRGITIEAVGDAVWKPGELANSRYPACLVISAAQITLRNLRFQLEKDQSWGCLVRGSSAAIVFDGCVFEAIQPNTLGISLESLSYETGNPPVLVKNCTFSGPRVGLRVSGSTDDNRTAIPCRGVLVIGNSFERCLLGITVSGEVANVAIGGNIFLGTTQAGIQFQHLLPGTRNLLVANNTFMSCESPLRMWENGVPKVDVEVAKNVSLSCSSPDWLALESGGEILNARGLGNGAAFLEEWKFHGNYREGTPLPEDHVFYRGWIPPGKTDKLMPEIVMLSREPGNADFLRPPADSPLSSTGVDDGLPDYVGAIRPHGVSEPNWLKIFEHRL